MYDDFISYVSLVTNNEDTTCYHEEMEVSDSEKWKEVMKEEMNGTSNLVELPKDRKTVGCKWVYKLKRGDDDKFERCKERLVAKGYSQKEGIDFHEMFPPIVKLVPIRVVLTIVALFNL
jgi:hypothetical protein